MRLRNFLLPKKSDSNLALLGPINDRSVQNSETTEVKGSLSTLAREMAKQQMMRDQQRESEGAQGLIECNFFFFISFAHCRYFFLCEDPITAHSLSGNQRPAR